MKWRMRNKWRKTDENKCKERSRGKVTATGTHVPFTSPSLPWHYNGTQVTAEGAKSMYHVSRSKRWHGGRYCTQDKLETHFKNPDSLVTKTNVSIPRSIWTSSLRGCVVAQEWSWTKCKASRVKKKRHGCKSLFGPCAERFYGGWGCVLNTKNRVESRLTTRAGAND